MDLKMQSSPRLMRGAGKAQRRISKVRITLGGEYVTVMH